MNFRLIDFHYEKSLWSFDFIVIGNSKWNRTLFAIYWDNVYKECSLSIFFRGFKFKRKGTI